ncbi:hypothetical protein MAH1_10550 [Sessilibacter sp. MAH1]
MRCPNCDSGISYYFLEEGGVEEGGEFECPSCQIQLRHIVDEGTYNGAQEKTLEIVDDD